MVNMVL